MIQFSLMNMHFIFFYFANNSLILYKTNEEQYESLHGVLKTFGEVNYNKSLINFGSKVAQEVKVKIKDQLGIINEGGADTYLGLPERLSDLKRDLLSYIHDKLQSYLHG